MVKPSRLDLSGCVIFMMFDTFKRWIRYLIARFRRIQSHNLEESIKEEMIIMNDTAHSTTGQDDNFRRCQLLSERAETIRIYSAAIKD